MGKNTSNTALLTDIRDENPNDFIKEILQPVVACLDGFDQLRILVHAENIGLSERRKKADFWRSEIRSWQVQAKPKFSHVELFYDIYGTPAPKACCEDWMKNIWLTFQDDHIERIVYLPYDVTYMDGLATHGEAGSSIQAFIDEANKEDIELLLGTYEVETPVDGAKDDTFLISLASINGAGATSRTDIS